MTKTQLNTQVAQTKAELSLLGCRMHNWSMTEAIEDLHVRLIKKVPTRIYYLNPDCLNKAFKNAEYREHIAQSERVFPDGSGIKIAARMTGQDLVENINGTDMFPHILNLAQEHGYRVFFLGAGPGVAESMIAKLRISHPDLIIAGAQHGFFKESATDELIKKINQSNADILFVAMGAPLQEKWLQAHFNRLKPVLMFAVGGLFDFYSERIPRAPLFLRSLGLEWTYRLYQEPRRMWKRYILGNPLFLMRIYRYKTNSPF